MPNRIIKESINSSKNMNRLSAEAERHFYRLLLLSDDHGCFEATPEVVRGKCYMWQLDQVSIDHITAWQNELGEKGILGFWEDDGRIFGNFLTFDKHNTKYSVTEDGKSTRHRRKTPAPPANLANLCQLLPTFANDVNSSQSLPNPNPTHNPNPKKNDFSKEKSGGGPPEQKNRKTPNYSQEELDRRWNAEEVAEILKDYDNLKDQNLFQMTEKFRKIIKEDVVVIKYIALKYKQYLEVVIPLGKLLNEKSGYLKKVCDGLKEKGMWSELKSEAYKWDWKNEPTEAGSLLGGVTSRSP
jgi:hypothetical protein